MVQLTHVMKICPDPIIHQLGVRLQVLNSVAVLSIAIGCVVLKSKIIPYLDSVDQLVHSNSAADFWNKFPQSELRAEFSRVGDVLTRLLNRRL